MTNIHAMHATVYRTPQPGDVLTPQFFRDVIELRANMEDKTGTGTLIARWAGFWGDYEEGLELVREEMFELGLPRDYWTSRRSA